jgi:hypothetical protein
MHFFSINYLILCREAGRNYYLYEIALFTYCVFLNVAVVRHDLKISLQPCVILNKEIFGTKFVGTFSLCLTIMFPIP